MLAEVEQIAAGLHQAGFTRGEHLATLAGLEGILTVWHLRTGERVAPSCRERDCDRHRPGWFEPGLLDALIE